VPATWFTIKDKTNCTIVQQLLADNHGAHKGGRRGGGAQQKRQAVKGSNAL
jgi:hypothetical protein